MKYITTIHLVYPHEQKARTPDAIGFNLAKKLKAYGYKVHSYDLYEKPNDDFTPTKNDILLGHPRWERNNTFNLLSRKKGWGRVIVLHPFCPLDLWTYAHLYFYCIFADRFIAITGKYWEKNVRYTPFAEWTGKFRQIDLAIDQNFFPTVKKRFNPPGKRKFIFIGNHTHYKNVSFLDKLAGRLKNIEFHRIGPKSKKFKNLIQHGAHELSSLESVNIIKGIDFMITAGNLDANPTTVIESSSMGLIAICPVGSGYEENDGVFNISGTNIDLAINQINKLNLISEVELNKKRKKMYLLIKDRYNWTVFTENIIKEIQSKKRYSYHIRSLYNLFLIYFFYYVVGKKSPWRMWAKKYFHQYKSYILEFFKS